MLSTPRRLGVCGALLVLVALHVHLVMEAEQITLILNSRVVECEDSIY